MILVTQTPLISKITYSAMMIDNLSQQFETVNAVFASVADDFPNPNRSFFGVQRLRVAPDVASEVENRQDSVSNNTAIFFIAQYEYACGEACENVTDISKLDLQNILSGLSGNEFISKLPTDFDIQSTDETNDLYEDPMLIDTKLDIVPNLIIPAESVTAANDQILWNGLSVKDLKNAIKYDLKLESFGNFPDVPEEKLTNLFGDGMAGSLMQYFVTIDKCRAICMASGMARVAATCKQELKITGLLTLQGQSPFQLTVFGLPTELADNINLFFDPIRNELDISIKNLNLFEEEIYKDFQTFFIRADAANADASKITRKGLIAVVLTESAKCTQFQNENPSDNMLNPSYTKSQIVVSFLVQPQVNNWQDDIRTGLLHKLEEVFNSVDLVERITFMQFRSVGNTGAENTGTRKRSAENELESHIVEFQILIKDVGLINHGKTLEESILHGIRIATDSYNYISSIA